MAEINLLKNYPKSPRPIKDRWEKTSSFVYESRGNENEGLDQSVLIMQLLLINAVRKFDREYFDGDRVYGYGGYYYEPRFWENTVKLFQEHYSLPKDAKILDVGCAKGFMLHDFKRLLPTASVAGLDISRYAYEHAMYDIKSFIKVGNAADLPYEDNTFDLVISINTVDHLPINDCKKAILEIQRVSKKNSFLTVNAWRNEEERERLEKWNITAQTCMHADDWKIFFNDIGYLGDYYWFVAE